MKKVIVFFNGKPCKTISVLKGVTSLKRIPTEKKSIYRSCRQVFRPTGDHEVIYVASDRELASQEIYAASKYL
jgi:hypothetical protein